MKHRMFTCYWDDKTDETTIKFSDNFADIFFVNFKKQDKKHEELLAFTNELANDSKKRAEFLKKMKGSFNV